METTQATGITGVAQSGWKWNTAVAVLAGGTYFAVAREVGGAPSGTINWPAGAAALAVAWAGTAVQGQLLHDYHCACLYAANKEIKELPDRVEKSLREKISKENYERIHEKFEGKIRVLKGVITAVSNRAWYGQATDLLQKLCGKGENHHRELILPTRGDILVLKDFPNQGAISGFAKMGPLGSGGMKSVYAALYFQKDLQGNMRREEDCAWVETGPEEAEHVMAGYQLALKLPEHPYVARPWRTKRILEENKLVRLIAIEPRFPTTLDRVQLSWKEMISCVRKITEAVAFLHKNEVLHRDLKPSNIFLKVADDGSMMPVIADFDIAGKLPKRHVFKHTGLVGTMAYMAPEHFLERNYGFKADVWSLALIVYDQVWRSAGGVERTDEANFPEFVLNAMEHYHKLSQQDQPTGFDFGFPSIYEKPKYQMVGETLCNQKFDWPKKLPEGGKALKHLIAWGLNGSVPRLPEGMALYGHDDSVDGRRCTAKQFLRNIPSDDEL